MAEALGIAASALQIADTANKLRKLCSDVKHASRDLHHLIEEVTTLATMLGEVEKSSSCNLTASSPGWQQCFNLFKTSSEDMNQITTELEKTLRSHRVTGLIRVYLKKDELDRYKDRLERVKGTMALAQQAYSCAIFAQQNETILHEVRAVAMRQQLQTVTMSTNINSIGGQNCSNSKGSSGNELEPGANKDVLSCSQNRPGLGRAQSTYKIRVPSWIFRKGLQVLVYRSHQSWGLTIRSYNQVSHDSKVFTFAEQGAWDHVRRLMDVGEASPWDINPYGETLLHIAVKQYDTDACTFLLYLGLDMSCRTIHGRDVLHSLGRKVLEDFIVLHEERQEAVDTMSVLLSHPDSVIDSVELVTNVARNDVFGASPSSLSLLINAMVPSYASLDKVSRAIFACDKFNLDVDSVMLKLGPDLTLHQAFDELQRRSSGCGHLTLLNSAAFSAGMDVGLSRPSQVLTGRWDAIIMSIIQYESQGRSNYLEFRSVLMYFIEGYCMAKRYSDRPRRHGSLHWNDYFTAIGRIWIGILHRLGANLVRYGKAEKSFLTRYDSNAIIHIDKHLPGRPRRSFSLRNLVYGPEVCDWVLYVVPVGSEYEMAGQFWDWVENPELFQIPGAFVEDGEEDFGDRWYGRTVSVQEPVL